MTVIDMTQIIEAEDAAKQDEQRMFALVASIPIIAPASLVKQRKIIIVRKKEAKCSSC